MQPACLLISPLFCTFVSGGRGAFPLRCLRMADACVVEPPMADAGGGGDGGTRDGRASPGAPAGWLSPVARRAKPRHTAVPPVFGVVETAAGGDKAAPPPPADSDGEDRIEVGPLPPPAPPAPSRYAFAAPPSAAPRECIHSAAVAAPGRRPLPLPSSGGTVWTAPAAGWGRQLDAAAEVAAAVAAGWEGEEEEEEEEEEEDDEEEEGRVGAGRRRRGVGLGAWPSPLPSPAFAGGLSAVVADRGGLGTWSSLAASPPVLSGLPLELGEADAPTSDATAAVLALGDAHPPTGQDVEPSGWKPNASGTLPAASARPLTPDEGVHDTVSRAETPPGRATRSSTRRLSAAVPPLPASPPPTSPTAADRPRRRGRARGAALVAAAPAAAPAPSRTTRRRAPKAKTLSVPARRRSGRTTARGVAPTPPAAPVARRATGWTPPPPVADEQLGTAAVASAPVDVAAAGGAPAPVGVLFPAVPADAGGAVFVPPADAGSGSSTPPALHQPPPVTIVYGRAGRGARKRPRQTAASAAERAGQSDAANGAAAPTTGGLNRGSASGGSPPTDGSAGNNFGAASDSSSESEVEVERPKRRRKAKPKGGTSAPAGEGDDDAEMQAFWEQQRAFWADVDAVVLEEKTPSP